MSAVLAAALCGLSAGCVVKVVPRDASVVHRVPPPVVVERPVVIRLSARDRQRIRAWYAALRPDQHPRGGFKPLPPGIRRQVQSGKGLPRGLARQPLPDELVRRLTRLPSGYAWVRVGLDVVIVESRTGKVHDLLQDAVPETVARGRGGQGGPPEQARGRHHRPGGPPEHAQGKKDGQGGPPEHAQGKKGGQGGPPEQAQAKRGGQGSPPEQAQTKRGGQGSPPEQAQAKRGGQGSPPEQAQAKKGGQGGSSQQAQSKKGESAEAPQTAHARRGRPGGSQEASHGKKGGQGDAPQAAASGGGKKGGGDTPQAAASGGGKKGGGDAPQAATSGGGKKGAPTGQADVPGRMASAVMPAFSSADQDRIRDFLAASSSGGKGGKKGSRGSDQVALKPGQSLPRGTRKAPLPGDLERSLAALPSGYKRYLVGTQVVILDNNGTVVAVAKGS